MFLTKVVLITVGLKVLIFKSVGCRELVYRSASRLLPALCRDLGDWQAATRSKAAGLISVLLLHLEAAATQHTQHLLSGLAAGLADVISRIAPTTNSVALLQLLPPVAYRGVPSAPGDLSVNQNGAASLVPRLPVVLQSGSAEVVEALTMAQQLLLASQLIGTLVESKVGHVIRSLLYVSVLVSLWSDKTNQRK